MAKKKDPQAATVPAPGPRSAKPMRRPGGPGMGMGMAEKSKDFTGSAKRLMHRLSPHRSTLIVIIALTVASVALNVIGPKVLGKAVDKIYSGAVGATMPHGATKAQVVQSLRDQGHGTLADMVNKMDVVPGVGIDFGALGRILLVVLCLYLVAGLFQLIQARLLNRVVQDTMNTLRKDVEAKINNVPLRYLDGQPRGELLSRVTNDIDNIGQSMQQSMSQLLVNGLTVIGVIVMMLTISWWLTLVAMIAIPVVMLVTSQVMKRSQKLFVAQWGHTGALNAQIEETFTGHDLVKVFGRQHEVGAAFDKTNESLTTVSWRAQFVSGLVMPVMMFVGNLQYVVVCVLGGLQVANGSMSLGNVTAFVQYSRQFTQPLTQLASMVNLMQSGVASAERVFEVLDAPEQSPDEHAVLRPTHGAVEFDRVNFGYAPDQPLIEDLSMHVEPGQTVAIVGPTGAGKTTLVNLIMRFYELDSGRILIDGQDITTVSRQDLRSRIGMVLQDAWLFHGTIRDNIAYGRLDATEDEILAAAKATFVDRFVRSLPDGYDTVIDEEGSGVSVGERQLITIARAFLADPAMLILDEATSSVDTRTEVMLQEAMAALRSDRTSFVIAHRLSTIRDADTILVMEDGHIVEQGDHDELLAARGAYYRLYMSQFEGAMTEVDPNALPAAP
ncbi:ABC transporter ATP-binding protein [Flexivirga oryzae]|uniref:Fatty acid ABC transporter ATP-binding/permease protein n=1 Tax=Flexivirga oryzae TaxID=1794944 RepID=A0A839NHZ3_9MICO|nr:ABC transporter ATP-binding protein [Flexivirga oryzae]MBB2894032.1 ATP-binding cassette subfamily B protein [Flexivirga oryzae]